MSCGYPEITNCVLILNCSLKAAHGETKSKQEILVVKNVFIPLGDSDYDKMAVMRIWAKLMIWECLSQTLVMCDEEN